MRGARALRRKMPRLETPARRNTRRMQEEFVRECAQILAEAEAPAFLGWPGSDSESRGSDEFSPDGVQLERASIASGPATPGSRSDAEPLDVSPRAVRDMFTAVYDDDSELLERLLAKQPDTILGSWHGMSVLRYAFMVHKRLEQTECLMLLLNRFTLLNQRHGPVGELKSVFADALVALCERPDPSEVQAALAVCFENYVMAHGIPWINTLATRLAARPQPVQSSVQVMQVLALDALGPHAQLPAVQALCSVWGADLAMMAAACDLGLGAIPAQLCGRGHQVARALSSGLQAHPELDSPKHAAMRTRMPALATHGPQHVLAELGMLMDQSPCSIRSAISA